MSGNGCNFASLFGSRGPCSELSGFFDAFLERASSAGRGAMIEIIDMFAMRKSDKQVRDKEARIPRVSPKSRFLVTGEYTGAAVRGRHR